MFWGGHPDIDKLLKIQKRCIRTMLGIGPREHCRHFLKQLKLLTVIDIYIFECTSFVKMNQNLFHQYLPEHGYCTRNKEHLVINNTKKNYVLNGVVNSCIRLFNKLPHQLKDTQKKFKNRLKEWLYERNFYSIKEFVE